jgi:hypothetical protein
MNISLTLEQMLSVFKAYNTATWPVQVIACMLGITAVFLTTKQLKNSNRIISAILSFIWLWTGIAFCIFYWAPVFTPSYAYAVLYIIQGIIFFAGIFKPKLSFRFEGSIYSIIGTIFVAYSLIGYLLVGYFLNHIYPQSVSIVLAPCPTVVFTFGMLLMTDKKVPKYILLIPLLWSVCGIIPVHLGVLEDIGLIIAGVAGTILIIVRDRNSQLVELKK